MAKKAKHTRQKRVNKATSHVVENRQRLHSGIERLKHLWDAGRQAEAIEEGQKLLKAHPRDPEVNLVVGRCYALAGDVAQAHRHLEAAGRLQPADPQLSSYLAAYFHLIGLNSHALTAARRTLPLRAEARDAERARLILKLVEPVMAESAQKLGVAVESMEEGSRLMEEGRMGLSDGDFDGGFRHSMDAVKLLPRWAVPQNNVAMSQFYLGKVEDAIATEEKVLTEVDRDNVHAMANLVLFHTVLGERRQAEAYGAMLEKMKPESYDESFKIAQAFVWLGRDQAVYDVLKKAEPPDQAAENERQWLLGVAAANLGRKNLAETHLSRVSFSSGDTFRSEVAGVIRSGLPGPEGRYPYFPAVQTIPPAIIDKLLAELRETMSGEDVLRALVQKYPPALDTMAERLWLGNDDEARGAANTLAVVGSRRAAEILRSFATGRVGSDQARMYAALALARIEGEPDKEAMTVFRQGKPTRVALREIRIVTSRPPTYSPYVERLLERAVIAQQEGRHKEAEDLYEKILAKDQKVKEAWGNLGVLYMNRGDKRKAEEFIKKALQVDPLYITGGTNLAGMRLSEGKTDEARQLVKSLVDVKEFHVDEMTRYQMLMARLALAEKNFQEAEGHLKILLGLNPDNEWAKNQLEKVRVVAGFEGFGRRMEYYRKQYKERKQKVPISPGDPIPSLLQRYPKDALLGLAREVFGSPVSSALKKDALVSAIHDRLLHRDTLERVLKALTEDDRGALRFVLQAGGMVPLADFAARYGDDAEESQDWNWHAAETVLGRLKSRGLLFEGTHEGRVVLLVPEEIKRLSLELAPQGL